MKEDVEIKKKTFSASLWLGGSNVFNRLFGFASKILLVRLLIPEDFAIAAIILSVLEFYQVILELSFDDFLVQNEKGDTQGHLNAVWWFQFARGLILFGVAVVSSPLIYSFYFSQEKSFTSMSKDEVMNLFLCASLIIPFKCFVSPKYSLLRKTFAFSKQIILNQGSIFLGTLTTIAYVLMIERSVWAIIIGHVCQVLIWVILSYIFCPFKPSFSVNTDSWRELFKFTSGIMGAPLLTFFALRMDILILAKMVPADALGKYYLVTSLAQLPIMFAMQILNPVLLPLFSKKQKDSTAVTNIFFKITKLSSLMYLPLFIYFVFNSEALILLVFGSKHIGVGMVFIFLCFFYFIQMQCMFLKSIDIALGRPEKFRSALFIRLCFMSIFVIPLIKVFGLEGAAINLCLGNLIMYHVQFKGISTELKIKIRDYIKVWKIGVLEGLASIFVLTVLYFLFKEKGNYFFILSSIFMLFRLCYVLIKSLVKEFDLKLWKREER